MAQIEELIAKAPRARHTLDHVAATADTVVRRALLLGERFWLPGSRVLCVGDHDLTSLAVRMIHPEAEVAVADIDERILQYVDAQELGIRTFWADLRLGLPPSVRGWADLAVTDPPYTPEGVGLFVARAAEGLRDRDQGRVLLAYGASERTPMLALKVQHALYDLNLLTEAMFPDFNRYHGAEAIGSAADLYVLRPTTKTWPAVASRVDRLATAIYTQGPQSVESARSREDLPGLAGIEEFAPGLLAGDWPRDLLPGVPRVRLSTWLAKPYAADPERVAVAVPAGLEAVLPRVLLAARARRVRVLLAAPPAGLADLAELVSPVYDLVAEGSVLDAVRRETPEREADRIARRVLDNAHGKAANSWREALVSARDLTKRQARALVPGWADATVLELPAHRLAALPHAAADSLTAASRPAGDGSGGTG
ncbi:bis-aminopropyl spermidine synthase family protein [Acrocarpospora phusangensis]|uniref:bis-aminopropyl spermidine synthase family protein n=1 Tax=Acrocarpospora phusangensis TaxID=1070424 RepID=UPI0023B2B8F4|nr:bis-aminopropyl spermidine synthase family protein [Acrocarpospora phusangensis]